MSRGKAKRRNRVMCSDGFTMSVQASEGNYCTPRNNVGPYSHVEVGFPSEKDLDLMPFAENPSKPTQTVYGWVPSSIVLLIIAKRGGMTNGELPPMGV